MMMILSVEQWLIMGTIVIGVVFMVVMIKLKEISQKTARIFSIICGIAVIATALSTSYTLLTKGSNIPAPWNFFDDTIVFAFVVLLKIAISFWFIAVAIGLFHPERISEFSAKIFGVELSHKLSQRQEYYREGIEKLDRQLQIINNFNQRIVQCVGEPFEELILFAGDTGGQIRTLVRDALNNVYFDFENIDTYVIPFDDNDINQLDPKLVSLIHKVDAENRDEEVNTIEQKTVGIAMHHGTGGIATVIIIDATKEKYEISPAEIAAASMLFLAVSSTVEWALRARIAETEDL